jgi:hypothetical protein
LVRATQPVDDALAWRRVYFAACDRVMLTDRVTLAQAQPVALDRTVTLWHMRHGTRPSPKTSCCAGCGRPVAHPVHSLPDGAAVCPTDTCLIAYGEKWRAAAAAGLALLGIEAPEGWQP